VKYSFLPVGGKPVNILQKEKDRPNQHPLTDTAFFHPYESKGKASCVPPEKH